MSSAWFLINVLPVDLGDLNCIPAKYRIAKCVPLIILFYKQMTSTQIKFFVKTPFFKIIIGACKRLVPLY